MTREGLTLQQRRCQKRSRESHQHVVRLAHEGLYSLVERSTHFGNIPRPLPDEPKELHDVYWNMINETRVTLIKQLYTSLTRAPLIFCACCCSTLSHPPWLKQLSGVTFTLGRCGKASTRLIEEVSIDQPYRKMEILKLWIKIWHAMRLIHPSLHPSDGEGRESSFTA